MSIQAKIRTERYFDFFLRLVEEFVYYRFHEPRLNLNPRLIIRNVFIEFGYAELNYIYVGAHQVFGKKTKDIALVYSLCYRCLKLL